MSAPEQFVMVPVGLVQPSVSDAARSLYMAIGRYAWKSTGSVCTASQSRLASDLGWSVAKVKRAAAELIQAGFLTRVHESGKSNRYALTAPESEVMGELGSEVMGELPPSSPVSYEAEEGETEEGKQKRRRPSKAKTPTARQLATIEKLATECSVSVSDVTTLAAASSEIDRLIALKRQRRETPPEPPALEPNWSSVTYDGDRVQINGRPAVRERELVPA